uniref:Uncharacterized protein n=1 Tax=Parascaris univalens TaxID=6257 RepID=A0A915CJD3_PARUN
MHSPSQIVEVLSRAFISANAFFCAKVSRTVCTKCFLRWSLAVTRDETAVQSIKASQCMEMRWSQELNGTRLEQIDANRGKIRTKQDCEITEEWALVTEEREPIFDAPPFADISEERLQWVLGMIDKNPQAWERSAEEQRKSMADEIRDDVEEIIEAESDAFQNSSASLARELEDVVFRW